jgi:hypothetical protein
METTMSLSTPQLDELLAAWNHHQDLRRAGATVAELAASRQTLDHCRMDRVAPETFGRVA